MFIKSSELCSLSSTNQKRIMFIIQFQKRFSSFIRNLPNIYISSKQASSNAPHWWTRLKFSPLSPLWRHNPYGYKCVEQTPSKIFLLWFIFIYSGYRLVATHLEHWSKKREKEGEKENNESSNSASTLLLTVTSMRVVWWK